MTRAKCHVCIELLDVWKSSWNILTDKRGSLLAEALFHVFAYGRKETSAMDRKWI